MVDITKIAAIYADAEHYSGMTVTVGGWAKTIRDLKTFGFIELNDGSCFRNLQVVMDANILANMPASNLTLVSQWNENDADYTAYNAAVAAAKAKQGEENYDKMYTAETRDALAGALAIDVAGKKYSEQSVVDAATKAINDAVAALEVMTYNAIFTVDGVQYEVVPTKVGEQIVAPKDPAKEGYVFKGWDKEVGKMGVEDITFAAQFEEASGIAYTVEVYTMDVNGNYGAAETKTLYGTTGAQVTATFAVVASA